MARNYQTAGPAEFQRRSEYARDETWIRAFLGRIEIGHLAHLSEGQPYVTPTNFWFDEQNKRIIFHSNVAGRLRSNLEAFPRVAFECMESGRFLPANIALEFSVQYRSAMVFGMVEILNDLEEQRRVLYALIGKYFPRMTPGKEFRPINDKELARTTVYALNIESWTGKENWQEKAEESPDWPPLPEGFMP